MSDSSLINQLSKVDDWNDDVIAEVANRNATTIPAEDPDEVIDLDDIYADYWEYYG